MIRYHTHLSNLDNFFGLNNFIKQVTGTWHKYLLSQYQLNDLQI